MTEYFPPEFAPPVFNRSLLRPPLRPQNPPPVLPDGSLSIREVARREGVSYITVRRWIRQGRLEAYLYGDKPGVAHLRVTV